MVPWFRGSVVPWLCLLVKRLLLRALVLLLLLLLRASGSPCGSG